MLTKKELASQKSAMLKIFKSGCKDLRAKCHYSYIHRDGLQYVFDGCGCILGVKTHLELPKTLDWIDVDNLKSCYISGEKVPFGNIPIEFLKEEIKKAKELHKPPVFSFGDGKPFVSAVLLYNMLRGVPRAKISIYFCFQESNVLLPFIMKMVTVIVATLRHRQILNMR